MRVHIKGISLIALIITLAVLIIVATITIQKGVQRTEQAQIAKHNTNISTTQEEGESYYYYQGGDLPVVNLTPYPIQAGSTLQSEIVRNGENTDTFYTIDLAKLGKASGADGSGLGNDIYIMSATRHTVYYVKGTTIKGVTYHGLISQNDIKLAGIATPTPGGPTSTPTVTPTSGPTSTPTPSPSPTPLPGSGYYDGIVNSPKLGAGMTAVKWNGSTWVAADPYNTGNDWYNYNNSTNKWANAQLADGSLLVWIPRYTYSITSGFHTNSATGGVISIRFTNGTTDDTSGGYRVQPAFYWGGWNIPVSAAMTKVGGGTELTGIWLSKFEPSSNGGKIKIIPVAVSWASLSVSNMFTTCSAMQTTNSSTYGISSNTSVIDFHMMKDSEWGAASYLASYARGSTEVTINANASFITADGNIITNKNQSTTGNEYGIYDMNGGRWENAAAYVDNANSSLTTYGNSLYTAAVQYKDALPKASTDADNTNYAATSQAYGFALYETSSTQNGIYGWFQDATYFPTTSNPFLIRGGDQGSATNSGLFCFNTASGGAGVNTFRVSCIIP